MSYLGFFSKRPAGAASPVVTAGSKRAAACEDLLPAVAPAVKLHKDASGDVADASTLSASLSADFSDERSATAATVQVQGLLSLIQTGHSLLFQQGCAKALPAGQGSQSASVPRLSSAPRPNPRSRRHPSPSRRDNCMTASVEAALQRQVEAALQRLHNGRPIAIGEPISRLYAGILAQRLVSYTEEQQSVGLLAVSTAHPLA
ncbi:hypothetical protein WJX82_005153 [Trebouxia sp. C0006]